MTSDTWDIVDKNATIEILVSFGDCDPAGIVYYPNFFTWMDRTFHNYLHQVAGGHHLLCNKLAAQGIGVMNAEMKFLSPAREGCLLRIDLEQITWSRKSFLLRYSAHIDDRHVLEGCETRGVFLIKDGKMGAGKIELLRDILANS